MLSKTVENFRYQKKSLADFWASIYWWESTNFHKSRVTGQLMKIYWFKKQWQELYLWKFYVTDNLQKLPSKDNMEYNRAWKMRSRFDQLQKHLQASLKPKSNQAIDENSRAKALWSNTWRPSPSNGGSSSVFNVALNSYVHTTLICPWVKKGAHNSVSGNLW